MRGTPEAPFTNIFYQISDISLKFGGFMQSITEADTFLKL